MPTSFSSPKYPGHSPHNTRCNYYFTSAPGTAIELAFSEIDTENCCDYLEVIKYKQQNEKLVKTTYDPQLH